MNKDIIAALQHRRDLLISELHWARKLAWFNDGADVYGATFWRCWLQFFFYLHFSNQWSEDNKDNWQHIEGVNWTGPLGAAFILGFIAFAGYYFMQGEKSRWIKSKLTPEFLLANEALKEKGYENIEVTQLIAAHMASDNDEKIRIEAILTFYQTNKSEINTGLQKDQETRSASVPQALTVRRVWEAGYGILDNYSYLHWLFWMAGTVILYQAKKGYGVNTDDPTHSDAPGFFDGKGFLFDYDLIYLELIAPLLLAIAAVAYTQYTKGKHAAPVLADQKITALRAYYQEKNPPDTSNTEEQTHSHFTGAMVSTAATTFISHFILMNIVAWPLSGFAINIAGGDGSDPMIVPYIFIATTFAAAVQVYYKLSDMKEEHKTFFKKGPVTVSINKVPENTRCPSFYRFKTVYCAKENFHHSFWYLTLGRLLGSGGILLVRILLNGGMGNFRVKEGQPEVTSMERMELLKWASIACVAVIALNMYQFYKGVERQQVMSAPKVR